MVFSDFIYKSASCFLGIYKDQDDLSRMVQALRKIPWHIIVKVGGSMPSPSELQVLSFPLIWIIQTSKFAYYVYQHCPKATQNDQKRIQLVDVWKEGQTSDDIHLQCPNYMKGHSLTFGYVPTGISIRVNSNLVPGGGFLGRMFEYLSQVFEFKPQFRMGPTVFHPKNGTWSGIPQQVP